MKLLQVCITLVIMTVYVSKASGTTFTMDGISYLVTSDTDHTVTLLRETDKNVISVEIPEKVSLEGVSYDVTAISSLAFDDCNVLSSIIIPKTVSSLSGQSFFGCTSLTNIIVKEENPVYVSENGLILSHDHSQLIYVGGGLSHPQLPLGIKSIESNAFSSGSYVAVDLPNTVTSIGPNAFWYCRILHSLSIPTSVRNIGDNALYWCYNLRKITIDNDNPNSIVVGNNAFTTPECDYDCHKYIYVPNKKDYETLWEVSSNVTFRDEMFKVGGLDYSILSIENKTVEVGDNSEYCSEYLAIPPTVIINDDVYTVVAIGKDAFSADIVDYDGTQPMVSPNSSSLRTIIIPESVISIGEAAFTYCISLQSIELPNTITEIGKRIFANCYSLHTVKLSDHLSVIPERAFMSCKSLKDISFPENIINIDEYAFYDCGKLESVILPRQIQNIGDYAFLDCDLSQITIPESLLTLGNSCFRCPLNKVIVESKNPITGGNMAFNFNTDAILYVPLGTSSLYRKEWTQFKYIRIIDASCDFLDYTILSETDCTIKAIGYSQEEFEVLSIPDKIVLNGKEYTIVSIADGVFSNNSALKNINLPNTITSLGSRIFGHCESLSTIKLPDNIKTIADGTFSGCSALSSVTFPTNLNEIGLLAFSDCKSLTAIQIPESVTYIGLGAFSGCSSLTTVELSDLTSISQSTFRGCSSLYSIRIPDTVKEIGNYAFSECSSINFIEIPASVESLGMAVFSGCTSLNEIIINAKLLEISHRLFEDCNSLEEINLPNSIINIGDNAFSGCSSLTSLTMPENLISLGFEAFMGCSSLKELNLNNSLTIIGGWAFDLCSSLTSVTLPANVTNIDHRAFSNCTSLSTVYSMNNTPPTIGHSPFMGCQENCILYVPEACRNKYETAWMNCGIRIIQEIDPNSIKCLISDDQKYNDKWIYYDLNGVRKASKNCSGKIMLRKKGEHTEKIYIK